MADFVDIDTLTVDSWGGADADLEQFTMDDFTYSVPAPGAIALLGIAALGTRRRRTA